mmetsp:Transcript_18682/g.43412  ORF Transcript_18682/g.43412 Transcript_18682/m.43412 type:complete len:267 (-) Transcript_18682:104-904(-)
MAGTSRRMRVSLGKRRPAVVYALAASVLALTGMGCSLAWVLPRAQQTEATLSRRTMLSLAAASSAFLPNVAPVFAARQIEVFGLPNDYFKANGIYSQIEGKSLNGRGVFKRDGAEFYLFLNECGEFTVDSKLEGCKGFAKEAGGKWYIDGEESKKFKVKPVESKAEKVEKAKEKKEAPKKVEAPSSGGGMPSFKLPEFLEQGSVDEAPGVKPSDLNVRGLAGETTGASQFFKTEKSQEDAFDRLSDRLGSFSPSVAKNTLEPKEAR